MKIFVIGCGATGLILINTLAKNAKVNRIYCFARQKRKAEEFVKRHPQVKIFEGDANDLVLMERLAKGSNLVVNAASPLLNNQILKLALKIGARYQDLGAYLGFDDGRSRMPYKIEHLAFDSAFKKKRLLALFDAGVSPGLTNLLVASAADKMALESVKIRLIEDIKSSVVISTWSPSTALDEIYSRPVIYHKGKFELLERFSDPETYKFPSPFGRKQTYSIMNNEAFTIPRYIRLKHIEVRSAGSDDESARIMIGLGLLNKNPIHIKGAVLTPLEFMMKIMPPPPTPKELKNLITRGLLTDGFFAVSIEFNSLNRHHKAKFNKFVRFPSQAELFKKNINSTYIAYPAGICAAAFALEIPNISSFGTIPPEGLPKENRERILSNIRHLGLQIPKVL